MARTSGTGPGGDAMPYIEPEALQAARRVDALTWLKENEPWKGTVSASKVHMPYAPPHVLYPPF